MSKAIERLKWLLETSAQYENEVNELPDVSNCRARRTHKTKRAEDDDVR